MTYKCHFHDDKYFKDLKILLLKAGRQVGGLLIPYINQPKHNLTIISHGPL